MPVLVQSYPTSGRGCALSSFSSTSPIPISIPILLLSYPAHTTTRPVSLMHPAPTPSHKFTFRHPAPNSSRYKQCKKKNAPNNKISSLHQSPSPHLGPLRNTPCSSARGIHEMLEPTVLNFGKRVGRRRQDFGVRHVNLKARCIVRVHVLVVGLQTALSSASVSPPYTRPTTTTNNLPY
jgi:hypothetical protein